MNPHDLTDAFATRRAVHATVSDRRDDFTVGRAQLGLAVVQTFFADDVHGNPPHLAALAFTRATATVMAPVSYRGAGPAMADLLAGHVPIIFLGLGASAPLVRSGKLRALAVTGRHRLPEFPDVPTFRESGIDLEGLEDGAWFGIVAPTGTPAPIIEKLNGTVNQALADPKTRSAFETKAFATVIGGTSEEFGIFLRAQQKFWHEILEAIGVRPN